MGRYPGRSHVCNFWRRSVKGFGRGKESNFHFPMDLRRRPYNNLALLRECVTFCTVIQLSYSTAYQSIWFLITVL